MKITFLLCLIFSLYRTLSHEPNYKPVQIIFRDDYWVIIKGNKRHVYQSAKAISQFGWLMVMQFKGDHKRYLLPIYQDQISKKDYHQLCLLIRL